MDSEICHRFQNSATLAALYGAGNYYYLHRRAHLEPEWAKKKLPWHYDHHMNSNQDANWCVTKPWFDYLLGTRVISSADLQEQNPLGLSLPAPISKKLNRWAEQYFPVKSADASSKMRKNTAKITVMKQLNTQVME